mmetsp:Transcript_24373/g.64100  ORF Transcript_24373/g.64100 Transcript_24373/m.64100 type:complete len:208 (-) Transcript_24373:184-807(-)
MMLWRCRCAVLLADTRALVESGSCDTHLVKLSLRLEFAASTASTITGCAIDDLRGLSRSATSSTNPSSTPAPSVAGVMRPPGGVMRASTSGVALPDGTGVAAGLLSRYSSRSARPASMISSSSRLLAPPFKASATSFKLKPSSLSTPNSNPNMASKSAPTSANSSQSESSRSILPSKLEWDSELKDPDSHVSKPESESDVGQARPEE